MKRFLLVPVLALGLFVSAQPASAQSCASLTYNLYFGRTDAQTGGEVSKLQAMLGGQVTGYFGPLTEQLVESFQASQGVVSSGTPETTGFGAVGPRTRALLIASCSGGAVSAVEPTIVTTPTTPTPTTEAGLIADLVQTDVDVIADSSYAQFQIVLDLTATDDDVYISASKITEDATLSSVAANSGWNVDFTGITASSTAFTVSSDASAGDTKGATYLIKEGDTKEFTITGMLSPLSNGTKMVLGAIQFGTSVGNVFSRTLYVDVNEFDTAPIKSEVSVTSFEASPKSVVPGGWSTLKWVSKNATSCDLRTITPEGRYLASLPTSGSYKVSPAATTLYNIYCSRLGPGGTAMGGSADYKEVTVSVATTSSSSVTFPKSTYDVENPTLTGTAKNLDSFTLVLTGIQDKYADVVFVKNGKWSHKVAIDLPNGTYGVEAYDPKGNLLGSGTFRVLVSEEPEAVDLEITLGEEPLFVYAFATHHGAMETCGDLDIGRVDWGDGQTESAIAERMSYQCSKNAVANLGHYYAAPGTYTIKFSGLGGLSASTKVKVESAVSVTPGVVAIGVYEGTYPAGTQRGFQMHPEGTVNVKVTGDTGSNRDLVLTSYEPVNWILSVQSGVKIRKIIVSGYHASRVTNVPSGTEVEYHSYTTDGQYQYAYQSSGDSYANLKKWLTVLYRGLNGDLDGRIVLPGYSASSIEVYLGYKG